MSFDHLRRSPIDVRTVTTSAEALLAARALADVNSSRPAGAALADGVRSRRIVEPQRI